MDFPKPQIEQSLNPRDYKVIVCVAGTRYFNDKRFFHEKILEFLAMQTEPVLFVSGAAASGADDLIIRWCDRFRYPCKRMPADWNNDRGLPNFNKNAAGFMRNEEMAQIITHLLAFFDGESHGTQDMIARCEDKKRHIQIFTIPKQPTQENLNLFAQSQSNNSAQASHA